MRNGYFRQEPRPAGSMHLVPWVTLKEGLGSEEKSLYLPASLEFIVNWKGVSHSLWGSQRSSQEFTDMISFVCSCNQVKSHWCRGASLIPIRKPSYGPSLLSPLPWHAQMCMSSSYSIEPCLVASPPLQALHTVTYRSHLDTFVRETVIYQGREHTVPTPAAGPGLISTRSLEGSSDHSGERPWPRGSPTSCSLLWGLLGRLGTHQGGKSKLRTQGFN